MFRYSRKVGDILLYVFWTSIVVVQDGECSMGKGVVGMGETDVDAKECLDEEVYEFVYPRAYEGPYSGPMPALCRF